MTVEANQEPKTNLLSLAALFHGEFSIDWIHELSGLKPSQILLDLNEALKQSWLTQKAPDLFQFCDAEKQQTLVSAVSESERKQWHRRIGGFLSCQTGNDIGTLQASVPHLIKAASDVSDYRKLVEIGYSLYQASRHYDALNCYEAAVRGLRAVKGDEADRIFVDAVYNYCRTDATGHDREWIITVLKEAMLRSRQTIARPRGPLLKMHIAKYEWYSGRHDLAIKVFNEAWDAAQKEGNPTIQRQALTLRMFFLWWQGRYADLVNAYEEQRTEVNRYPRSVTPLLATSMLGVSYVWGGQVARGLGLLSGLRDQCRKLGNTMGLIDASQALAISFLEVNRTDEAAILLEEVLAEHREALSDLTASTTHAYLALAYGQKGNYDKAMMTLRTQMDIHSSSPNLLVHLSCRILMPLVPDVTEEELRSATGISLEKTVSKAIAGGNVCNKGLAYSLKARLMRKAGASPGDILDTLLLSVRWLEESGNIIELAKLHQEIARAHLQLGDAEKARDFAQAAFAVLSPINKALIQEDTVRLIEDAPDQADLMVTILGMTQEISAIRNYRELVKRIILTTGRITRSERGGIFLQTDNSASGKSEVTLAASITLTHEDIADESFKPSMQMIHEVIAKGVGRILNRDTGAEKDSPLAGGGAAIRSCFCVPLTIKRETIGALYCDNRLTVGTVTESDLEMLSYFAGQAAIALDNARAYDEIERLNRQLQEEKSYYQQEQLLDVQYKDFVGKSPAIQRTFGQIQQVAGESAAVLVTGETGVGKELVARTIHSIGERSDMPFIRVDCSALSETLITSELFGHEKGAYSGAIKQRIGRFELANGGTLFLDEIGNIPLSVQNRLLSVLETKQFERVGGSDTIRSDFRLIAATNDNLEKAVKAGRFREDLFYRLNVFPIVVPPLRERREDIPLLAHFFLENHARQIRKPLMKVPKAVMEQLVNYEWPGNVRELANVIERGVITSAGSRFRMPVLLDVSNKTEETGFITLEEMERRHILRALDRENGKIHGKGGAAECLGIHPSTLRSRMKRLGIKRDFSFT